MIKEKDPTYYRLTDNERILTYIIDSFCRSKEIENRPKYEDRLKRKGSYSYIPFDTNYFYAYIATVRSKIMEQKGLTSLDESTQVQKRPTFIDYGAGIGVTVKIAERLGFFTTGIEIDDKLINLCNTGYGAKIVRGDLTKPTVFAGKSYDVVYFYCPFYDREKELEFELKAINTVKVGGYLIAPHPGLIEEYYGMFKTSFNTLNSKSKVKAELNKIKFYNKMKNFEKINSSIFKRIK